MGRSNPLCSGEALKAVLRIQTERNSLLLYRHEEEIAPCSPLDWLERSPLFPKFYFEERDTSNFFAASGRIASFFSIPQMTPLEPSPVRLWGWRHFLPTDAVEWILFPKELHSLSRYELFTHHGRTYLAENQLHPHPYPRSFHSPIQTQTLSLKYQQSLPTKEAWLAAIPQRSIEKVVLARRMTFKNPTPIHPLPLLRSLSKQNHFFLLVQLAPHLAFLSATPEKLYRRTAQHMETEAIAGTQKEGPHSEKEHREFFYVEKALHQALATLCREPPLLSPLTTLSTHSLHHLYRSLQAPLKEGINDTDILNTLHPTPAVAGWPTAEALDILQQVEPFQRGLYAAPIGWTSCDEALWLVGIRSCLIEGDQLHLYSGAGVVEGSDGEQEWEELNHKLSWLLGSD